MALTWVPADPAEAAGFADGDSVYRHVVDHPLRNGDAPTSRGRNEPRGKGKTR